MIKIIIYILLFLIGVFLFQLLNKKEKLTISATDLDILDKEVLINDKTVIDYLLVYLINFFDIFKNTYEEFNDEYPVLYRNIIDETLDDNTFRYMLNMLYKQNSKKSKSKKKAVDVEVGQYFVDQYVKPKLSKK